MDEECGEAPEAWELLQDEDDSVGAGEQAFVSQFIAEGDIDRVQIVGFGAVTGKDARGERTLQRGESEDVAAITAKNKLDEPVTEPADAVVEQDGAGHLFETWLYFVPDAGGCGPA